MENSSQFTVHSSQFTVHSLLDKNFSFSFRRARVALWLFFISCALCLFPVFVFAQDIMVEAEVSAQTVALDDYLRLTITVTGVQTLDPVDLPAIEGFQSRFVGPSSRVSIINGKYASSYAFLYDLFPEKTGTWTIPSLTVTVQGKAYATQPVTIEVVSSSGRPAPGRPGNDGTPSAEALKDRLFLVMASPLREGYLHQRVPVVVRIYIAGLSVRDIEFPQIEHSGFLMDPFETPRQFEEVINGMRYTVVEFRTSVYPMRSGELSLGPARGRCNILMRSTARSRPGGLGLFDDDFFSGFFESYTSRPAGLESEELPLTVLPLPEDGRPAGFSGAVGRFAFHMDVSPKKVKVGDPVTVRMTVTGQGSLQTFELPAFQTDQHFRVYDPTVRDENGVKLLEQVLIPRSETSTTVPAVHFSFFNPEEKQYQTIARGPVTLEVEPVAKGQEFRVIGAGDNGLVRRDDVGRDIGFIKADPGRLMPAGYGSVRSFGHVVGLVVIAAAWAGGVLFFHFTRRMKTDERFARRMKAPFYARKGLARVKVCLETNETAGFYDEVFKTLQRYLAHKFHLAPGAVTAEALSHEFQHRGASGIDEKIAGVFAECEAFRYASAGFSKDDMARTYQAVREIIDWCERKF